MVHKGKKTRYGCSVLKGKGKDRNRFFRNVALTTMAIIVSQIEKMEKPKKKKV
jgi:hypothetical protein